MNTKEFLSDERFVSAETRAIRANPKLAFAGSHFAMRRRVLCADGFSLSVQYSAGHYCNARETVMGGEWDGKGHWPKPKSVEIGFPSGREPLLKPYAEQWLRPVFEWFEWQDHWAWPLLKFVKRPNWTKTVYAWVPIKVADKVLAKHGGIIAVRSEDHQEWEML